MREKASPIVKGIEDKFCYAITEDCIGCLRAFSGKGITPRHLVDLLLGLETALILQPLDEYHAHARYTENVLTEELVAAGGCAGCPGGAANRG